MSPSRDFNFGSPSEWWLPENSSFESTLPPYTSEEGVTAAERTIEVSLDELDLELYKLSIKIHGLCFISSFGAPAGRLLSPQAILSLGSKRGSGTASLTTNKR